MPLTVKIHAGDWGECTAGFRQIGLSDRHEIALPRGRTGFSGYDRYILDRDVVSAEALNETNKARVMEAAGWGIAGGAIFGPAGLLAGMLLGGKGTSVIFVCQFRDGKKILASTDNQTFQRFQLPLLTAEFNKQMPQGAPHQAQKSGGAWFFKLIKAIFILMLAIACLFVFLIAFAASLSTR